MHSTVALIIFTLPWRKTKLYIPKYVFKFQRIQMVCKEKNGKNAFILFCVFVLFV